MDSWFSHFRALPFRNIQMSWLMQLQDSRLRNPLVYYKTYIQTSRFLLSAFLRILRILKIQDVSFRISKVLKGLHSSKFQLCHFTSCRISRCRFLEFATFMVLAFSWPRGHASLHSRLAALHMCWLSASGMCVLYIRNVWGWTVSRRNVGWAWW